MGTMIDAGGCRRRYRSTKSGKLFFCFNSRFFSSSSSMNISSRSILSPARHRDHPLSLSASLSRRLRSDGSLKGGQSPMFPTTNASKKRTAGALENPEPSSPKVTCIGQVRVKSRKKKNNKYGRKLRNPSRRRSGGDGSFRRTDNLGSVDLSSSQTNIPENRHRNQRWVHLPLTICEGLKGLGAEISCLLPCRSSSCFSSSSERGSKRERSIRSNLEEMEISRDKLEEGNKLDSSDDEDGEEDEGRVVTVCVPPKNALLLMRCRSDPMKMTALSRRLLESPLLDGDEREDNNVDKDADFEDPEPEWCSQANANLITTVIGGEEADETLEANSIIDIPEEEEEVDEVEHFDVDELGMDEEFEEETEQVREELQEENEDCKRRSRMEEEKDSQRGLTMEKEEDNLRASTKEEEEDIKRDSPTMEEEEDIKRDSTTMEEEEDIKRDSTTMEEEEDIKRGSTMEEEENIKRGSTMEEEEENIKRGSTMEEEEEEDIKRGSTMVEEEEEDIKRGSTMVEEEENEMNEAYLSVSGKEDDQKFIGEEKKEEEGESVFVLSDLAIESSIEMENVEEKAASKSEENEEEEEEEEESLISGLWPEDDPAQSEREMPSPSPSPSPLPDCLLLMMGEPKVSMEVSKETWVCTTDFMRFLPERRRRPANKALAADVDEPEKKVVETSTIANTNNSTSRSKPELKQAQPPRSSCSIPGKAAPVLTAQKLPRCKSEPMRTAAAKLVPPETCMWKSRKVEPLSRATVGVGSAAGVGF